ncbi:Heme/hemopexin transporter protein huxB precursor [Moraxella lacunata]|uniref:Heme/hemopexin transporter protein huxB n=1 Tax=Moraxella lacunata TaxID=477 RepID=A0A378T8U6_MORLA|nr:ShlB/FhaC/HecB family hemolysin secretion/activation protein [Moraxella lacunata]STZ55936.1 Heme/hemopexin transporter protein huxB precursor [Moraxella lacunata]
MQKSLLTLSILLATTASYAQDAGTILREVATQPTITPATITPLTTETGDISTDTTPISVSDVVLVGNTLLSAHKVEPHLASIRGTSTTFGGLQSLARAISDEYHKAGYPLATVIIPPQRLEGGVVRLQVIEGSIGDVVVNNTSRVSDKAVKGYLDKSIKTGQPLRQTDSERALLLIKDLAGTDNVNYRLQGGNNGTDLAVELDKSRLVDGFVQVDNYGSKSTGEVRTRAGVNLNSPFGRGERFSIQAMSSFKGVDYARASLDVPVGYDGLMVSAGVGHTTYELGGAFKDLQATGTADTIDVGIRKPLVRSNRHNVWASSSLEHRDLQDKVNSTSTVTDKSIKAVRFGFNGYHQDSLLAGGYTQWGVDSTIGKLDIDSADAKAIDSISARTDGNYHKLSANVARTQYLSPKLSLNLSANGQWANKNLDSAEQMSLGGADGISAYHSNDVSADIGVIGQAEVRYALLPNLTVSGFYDVGRAKLRAKPYTTQENFINLHGGGVGLYTHYKNLSLQGKVAWQGGHETFNPNKDPRVWVRAGYNF